ncbi:hypothetical protein M5E84_10455 [[Ruminococcus] torques]|nr:hypothetical protein M5E84_10455 [[Ruminococcus] torques]
MNSLKKSRENGCIVEAAKKEIIYNAQKINIKSFCRKNAKKSGKYKKAIFIKKGQEWVLKNYRISFILRPRETNR